MNFHLFKLAQVLVLIFLIQIMTVSTAYAYIDPGTGSYLFQMLIAGLLGSAFAIKMAWRNVRTYISQIFSSNAGDHDSND